MTCVLEVEDMDEVFEDASRLGELVEKSIAKDLLIEEMQALRGAVDKMYDMLEQLAIRVSQLEQNVAVKSAFQPSPYYPQNPPYTPSPTHITWNNAQTSKDLTDKIDKALNEKNIKFGSVV